MNPVIIMGCLFGLAVMGGLIYYFYNKNLEEEDIKKKAAELAKSTLDAANAAKATLDAANAAKASSTDPTSAANIAAAAKSGLSATTIAAYNAAVLDKTCNKTECNAVMSDWIKNKYWAFDTNNFGQCVNCDRRQFKSPYQTSKGDGGIWQPNAGKDAAYDSVYHV